MSQVTLKQLQGAVDRLNRTMGTPMAPYGPYDAVNRCTTPNALCYHLSGAYSGYALHQMMPTGTGVRDVLGVGHVTKREILALIYAFLAGIAAAKGE